MAKEFSDLYFALGDTTSSEEKIALLVNYLTNVSHEDFGWAIYLLQGGKCKGGIRTTQLREWVREFAGLPQWLVEESYGVVGDLAETISLLVSAHSKRSSPALTACASLRDWITLIQELSAYDQEQRKQRVMNIWRELPASELMVFTKLLTGGLLRVGVSKGIVARALSKIADIPHEVVWQRLSGSWSPDELSRNYLTKPPDPSKMVAPYPFFLAYPLQTEVEDLGSLLEWEIEWKWDGIRGQIVKRGGVVAIWSRGDELVTESFPEIAAAASMLPDGTVLDGEIVAWNDSRPGSFFDLQKRINRKKITAALCATLPVRFITYDLLEHAGVDVRTQSLDGRRLMLSSVYGRFFDEASCLSMSKSLVASTWSEIKELQQKARNHDSEGLMLKRRDSVYGVGRTQRGAWWKWKVEPYSIDAVLMYAQKGHGRRANLFTDYTFGVWDGDRLVTFAKAYSGLSGKEIAQVDSFIKKNTRERFGPVRTVAPELVFELAFEAIQTSSRHRSGVAVRFPRIKCWRRDKSAAEADTLETLRALVGGQTCTTRNR